MGLLAAYSCPGCGYRSADLPLWPPPHPEKFNPVLVTCPKCKKLEAVHLGDVDAGCKKHKVAYARHDEEKVPCPRCGEALEQESLGMWD